MTMLNVPPPPQKKRNSNQLNSTYLQMQIDRSFFSFKKISILKKKQRGSLKTFASTTNENISTFLKLSNHVLLTEIPTTSHVFIELP